MHVIELLMICDSSDIMNGVENHIDSLVWLSYIYIEHVDVFGIARERLVSNLLWCQEGSDEIMVTNEWSSPTPRNF